MTIVFGRNCVRPFFNFFTQSHESTLFARVLNACRAPRSVLTKDYAFAGPVGSRAPESTTQADVFVMC